ncbi:hypothetical protein NUW58_g4867 [Xylaria curta]|uniref:Uncharacterized protein n=1 Tax=Xylaria curta TaxID=42375 RepID=A0ACC1P655_9PEZI|nr:hypothetical protein NUW58_g4867 [Xylaria curta]
MALQPPDKDPCRRGRVIAAAAVAVAALLLGAYEKICQLLSRLAAWFERAGKFRSTDDLVIPVLIATAEHWDLWFAIDGRDYFNVYGPLAIGGTDDLESIYLLRYCLSCLGDWMATDFRRWVQLCVGAA